MVKETVVRKGFLSDEQYVALRNALPEELKLLFVVDFLHGIRRSELLSIQWSQVDLEQMVIHMPPDKEKHREGRNLPIVPGDMENLLRAAKNERDGLWPECPWVFHRSGQQIRDLRGTWNAVVKKLAIQTEDGRRLTLHDLRRTAIRNMRRAGVPQVIRMKISGHRTDSMERRYNIADDDDIRIAAQFMAERMKVLSKTADDNPSETH